jgi:hypothetical protein
VFATQVSASSPKELLSRAIQSSNQLQKNIPTKDKLAIYEGIFSEINQITEEHGASDEALKLLSNQTIGTFNPSALRSDYIKLLSEYYDTVCEASPSYNCLGFVSLNNGIKQCASASNYNQILSAHNSLLNAINIFIGQEDDSGYAELAMGAYQSCLSESSLSVSEWGKDHFASMLVEPLIKKGKKSTAKSIIENMTTPYFKFSAVLALQQDSHKKADEKKIARLEKFIKDDIPHNSLDAFLASVELRVFSARHGSNVIDYVFAYNSVQSNRPKFSRSCNKPFVDYLYDMMTDWQLALHDVDKSRLKNLNDDQLQMMYMYFADHPKDGLNACESGGKYDYSLMTKMHGALLAKKGAAAAKAFKVMTQKQDLTNNELYDYYANELISNEAEMTAALDKGRNTFENLFYRKEAKFALFHKYVDIGNVCESSKILFQDLKGTKNYNSAINYMVTSPSIDPSQKYECGDEELELLLN